MNPVRLWLLAPLLVAVSFLPALAGGGPGDIDFDTGQVTVETANGSHVFNVEIARTGEQRARGLMYRERLGKDEGMLFIYPGEGPVSMWMRNTYLSLDILYIRSNGEIAVIKPNAEPLSNDLMSSGTPVHSVLELPAGTAARLGIEAGDRVIHETFTPDAMPESKNAP